MFIYINKHLHTCKHIKNILANLESGGGVGVHGERFLPVDICH